MFWENFKNLCDSIGESPAAVAKKLGFSNSATTHWKQGRKPTSKSLQAIADFFDITVDELLNGGTGRLRREQGEKIAVLSTVGAGIPLEAINMFDQDDPDSWEEISKLDAQQGEYFALRIRGNSMEPEIHHGDLVIVRCTEEAEDGDFVVALVNGDEGLCKILRYRDNGIALCSLNEEYPPLYFNREQIADYPVRIMGVVEEIRRKPKRR